MSQAQILVVEDEHIIALDIKKRLESLGYAVPTLASSGKQAVQKAAETRPHLVLMDINLKKGMDGIAAAERIRARFDIPVVYLTSYADEATLQRAKLTAPFGYLLKPFQQRELYTTLETALYKHQVERQLRESEEKYRLLVENANEAIVVAQDGLLKFFNPKACEITGHSAQELAGKPFAEIVHPDDHQAAVGYYLKCLQGEKTPQLYVLRAIGKDGRTLWLESNAVVITWEGRPATLSFIADITERVQGEEALRESEERFRNVFENSPLGIYRTTPDGHILMANTALVRMLGYSSAEELSQRNLESEGFHPHHSRTGFKRHIERDGQIAGLESAWIRKDGSTLWVRENAKAVRQNGNILFYEGTVEDITQRKRALDELTTLNQISQAINSTLDLQEILTIITDHATHLLGLSAASVVLRDPPRGDLWFAAASGIGSEFIQGQRLAIGQGIAGWVVQHGQPTLVTDVEHDARFYDGFDPHSSLTTRSILCVPLRTKGRIIGAIEAMNKESSPFDQEDLRLLTSLAELAATAIENARLHAETQRRAEQLAVLHELDRAITASLRITDVYHALARQADRLLLSYDHMSITLIEGDEVHLTYVADAGDRVPPLETTLPLKTSSVGWVANMGQPLLRHHIAADPRFPGDEPLMVSGIQSAMIIPLRIEGQVIGTCNVGSRQVAAYTPDDLVIAQFMADQLAIAIQNARLFEAEQHARQVAEVLRAAHLAFTHTLNLEAVLNALLDYLSQFVSYDHAQILLSDEAARLVVHAVRGQAAQLEPDPTHSIPLNVQRDPIIQRLLISQESLLIPDTAKYPNWEGCAEEEPVHTWLGVPLIASGEVIGVCTMSKAQPGCFSQQQQHLAEALAAQAAVAIQNARLFEQVRLGRERLQSLSRQLVEVQEIERRNIARELHDEAGQALTSLMVGLRLLEEEHRSEAIATRIADLKHTVDSVLESLHQLASDLRPASLDHLGLVAALRQYTETFSRQHHLAVQFETVGFEARRLSPMAEIALYRIVQEALTNVARHAQATRVDVLLECHGDRLIALVEDNGLGFDPQTAMQRGRLGLPGMRERAEMLGGSLEVESSPEGGTTLFVEVPHVHSHPDR